MTSSVLPSASFSFATRFISPRSATGDGIAASAVVRTSPESLTNSGEKKSATISRSGLAAERASERILRLGFLSVVEVRPGGLDEHARSALGIARRRGGALELERGLPELAGVDGLSRFLLERLRAFLGAGGAPRAGESPRPRGYEDSHSGDSSYSFFNSIRGIANESSSATSIVLVYVL